MVQWYGGTEPPATDKLRGNLHKVAVLTGLGHGSEATAPIPRPQYSWPQSKTAPGAEPLHYLRPSKLKCLDPRLALGNTNDQLGDMSLIDCTVVNGRTNNSAPEDGCRSLAALTPRSSAARILTTVALPARGKLWRRTAAIKRGEG
jgi:hypothetical protein